MYLTINEEFSHVWLRFLLFPCYSQAIFMHTNESFALENDKHIWCVRESTKSWEKKKSFWIRHQFIFMDDSRDISLHLWQNVLCLCVASNDTYRQRYVAQCFAPFIDFNRAKSLLLLLFSFCANFYIRKNSNRSFYHRRQFSFSFLNKWRHNNGPNNTNVCRFHSFRPFAVVCDYMSKSFCSFYSEAHFFFFFLATRNLHLFGCVDIFLFQIIQAEKLP